MKRAGKAAGGACANVCAAQRESSGVGLRGLEKMEFGALLFALLVLLCADASRAQTTGNTLRCGSEDDLLENLRFVRTACERAQGPESFADGDTLVPAVVTVRACAEVIHRVAISCNTLLGRSPWFASRNVLLDEAVQMATALGEDGAGGLLGGAQNPFLMTAPDATAISQSSQVSYADQS